MYQLRLMVLILLVAVAAPCQAEDETMQVAGGHLTLHWDDSFTQDERSKLRTWLERIVPGVTLLYGSFPIPESYVELRRSDSRSGPVPWGQVLRGNPDGILLVVNPKYDLEEISRDWTASHEFSHLFIPYPGDSDIWFTEGLATYLQTVLQTRNRLYSEQTGWQKLYEGFMRGHRQAARHKTPLSEASPNMWATNGYMRVYWTGAAYFLLADTRLLAQSQGNMGLASVLQQFSDCCLQGQTSWSALALARKFDHLSASNVFSQLYFDSIEASSLPPWQDAFNWLGIGISQDKVRLSDSRIYKNRRRWIMSAQTGQETP